MRLKAELWVKAYIRRVNSAGAMAMVVARGDADAGAIYVKVSRGGAAWRDDRTAALFGPAPAGLDEVDLDRRWVCVHRDDTPEETVEATLTRQRQFDSDIWIIEVEDRDNRHFLDDWLVDG